MGQQLALTHARASRLAARSEPAQHRRRRRGLARLASLLLAALLLCGLPSVGSAAAPSDPGPRWETLDPALRQVLAPVAADWNTMPGFQRQRLVNAAKHFPQLTPIEQQRFLNRLPQWAKLPHETRLEARDTFRKYHALPSDKKEAIKKRWTKTIGGSEPTTSAAGTTAPSHHGAQAAPPAGPASNGMTAAPGSAAEPATLPTAAR